MQKYQPPTVTVLGSVRELTQSPPGKQFTEADGSDFQGNFSCTRPDDLNCEGGFPGQ